MCHNLYNCNPYYSIANTIVVSLPLTHNAVFRLFSLLGVGIERIAEVLLEIDNWESLAGWLGVNHHTIRTNCGSSSDHASCFRRLLAETYCDTTTKNDMHTIAENIAFVLETEMNKRRQADILKNLPFSGEIFKEYFHGMCIPYNYRREQ